MADTCSNCRMWRAVQGALGNCRRRPPTLLPEAGLHAEGFDPQEQGWDYQTTWMATRFPVTHGEEWCAKYEPSAEVLQARADLLRIEADALNLVKLARQAAASPLNDGCKTWLADARDSACRRMPHLIRRVDERALELTDDEAVRAMLRWAGIDNALEVASRGEV